MADLKISALTEYTTPLVTDVLPIVDVAGSETKKITWANLFKSPTLITPNLGTPTAGVMTNVTGTAAGLTAGTVTTNANLTGHITSTGNATLLGSFTLAQLNTAISNADVATGGGTATGTNTGDVANTALTTGKLSQFAATSSAELAGVINDETGTGLLVFATNPVLTTPNLGTPSTLVGTNISGTISNITLVAPALGTPASGVATNITGLPAGAILPGTLVAGTYLLAENASIGLDPAGSADGKYTGITVTGTAGTTIAFGDLIYLAVATSKWVLTDADAAATSGGVMIGMAVTASTDTNPVTILLQGIIRADAKFPALTIGAAVYVGETAGEIQVAIPTGADNVIRVVGFALTADEIYFNPSQDHQVTVA